MERKDVGGMTAQQVWDRLDELEREEEEKKEREEEEEEEEGRGGEEGGEVEQRQEEGTRRDSDGDSPLRITVKHSEEKAPGTAIMVSINCLVLAISSPKLHVIVPLSLNIFTGWQW